MDIMLKGIGRIPTACGIFGAGCRFYLQTHASGMRKDMIVIYWIASQARNRPLWCPSPTMDENELITCISTIVGAPLAGARERVLVSYYT